MGETDCGSADVNGGNIATGKKAAMMDEVGFMAVSFLPEDWWSVSIELND